MMFFRRGAVAAAAFVVFALAVGGPSAQTPPLPAGASPKLVVVLVADQMRWDYPERHAAELTGGLQRMMREGAWFTQAAYPYLGTVTCPGHATIGTGAFPYKHGMILNEWVDRQVGIARGCTRDASVEIVTYAPVAGPGIGESPRDLLVPTLADQIRERAKGRVVTMSLKPRAAIVLAGRKADTVVWFDDRGTWATSSAYTKKPVPFIEQFVSANPMTDDVAKVWELTLAPEKYKGADDGVGERPPTGWTRLFPHPLAETGRPDGGFRARWKASPFADEYLARMAAASVDALRLGRGEGVDFLGVAFSSLDTVGHGFGPDSHEVQDMVIRLDRTIGKLLDHLDSAVGRGNYVVGFSSDHGVAPIPDQVPGAGRQAAAPVLAAINEALRPHFGPGDYAVISAYTDIYLVAGAADRLRGDSKARTAVLEALRALPGVMQAFTADELASSSARSSADPVKRAAALSYHRKRSGDLIIIPRKNWLLSSSATTHGTHHDYDQRVPVMFYGAGVRAGEYTTAATPADIAPTLAAIAKVRVDQADGRPLTNAIATTVTTKR
jgi:predicted AlkP superfamily pyrophosphatase or phosphodiesterase